MSRITEIINEEIMTTVANYPQFGDRLHLNETGEGSAKPYPYKFNDVSFSEVEYTFETEDQDEYIVEVINTDMINRIWDMQFNIKGEDHEYVADKGRMFSVMSTLLKISEEFIEKYKPNILKFRPSDKEGGEPDMRRFKLYLAYVERNIKPEYYAYEYYPFIVIERKVKIKSNIPQI